MYGTNLNGTVCLFVCFWVLKNTLRFINCVIFNLFKPNPHVPFSINFHPSISYFQWQLLNSFSHLKFRVFQNVLETEFNTTLFGVQPDSSSTMTLRFIYANVEHNSFYKCLLSFPLPEQTRLFSHCLLIAIYPACGQASTIRTKAATDIQAGKHVCCGHTSFWLVLGLELLRYYQMNAWLYWKWRALLPEWMHSLIIWEFRVQSI